MPNLALGCQLFAGNLTPKLQNHLQICFNNSGLSLSFSKYYDFRDCARGVLNDADNSICPDDSKAYYTRISQSVQSDVLESVCSTVDAEENSAKCNELKIDVSGTEEEAKHKSVLAPIREILSKMFNKEQ